jgi:hypothetical protein
MSGGSRGPAGRDLGFEARPCVIRLLPDAGGVEALPVIGDLDEDVAAFVVGVQHHAPGLGLAGAAAVLGAFQAMVGAVAHHVRQRVLDELQHLAVELGLRAAHLELDLLAELARQVTDQARQLRPGIADRLHAGLHHAVLQVGRDVRQPLQRHAERLVAAGARHLHELVARQHQLADQHHQAFEHVDGDADALRRRGAAGTRIRRDRVGLGRIGLHGLGRIGLGRAGLRHGGAGYRGIEGVRHRVGPRRPAAAIRQDVERRDQRAVVPGRLGPLLLDAGDDFLDAVERPQDQGDAVGRHLDGAVAVAAQHVLGGMRHALQPRQAEEAAGALDRVDHPEDLGQRRMVVRRLLEPHQRDIERREALMRLGQEVRDQVVHGHSGGRSTPPDRPRCAKKR